MPTQTKIDPVRIPDEALHLATDGQLKAALTQRGHKFHPSRRLMVVEHKESGVQVAWQPTAGCEPHPLRYRAQILRTLVRLGFFAVFVLGILHFALGIL